MNPSSSFHQLTTFNESINSVMISCDHSERTKTTTSTHDSQSLEPLSNEIKTTSSKKKPTNAILKRKRQNSFDSLQAAQYMIQRIVNTDNLSSSCSLSNQQIDKNGNGSNKDLSNTDLFSSTTSDNEVCNFLEQILSKNSSLIVSGETLTRGKRTKRVHVQTNSTQSIHSYIHHESVNSCQAPHSSMLTNNVSLPPSFYMQSSYQLSFMK
ncbi:hypothetical protein C9374_004485 [Naegleria lovaniensis]|uniref:Uncharacterized protein n=1 Tax=Naegleria lovaniensis TaxID=51637 RepID=A0AA88KKL7_NAELO|nr:uncharacterized protein C9374_004485 [Naegleria lovaniensis]KAG2383148.1 hypothetical protein C9374_004485 [Naegleria lovaniensis]